MYDTGIDPFTRQPVKIARNLNDRIMQRALMQFFNRENYFLVRDALVKSDRGDLIGGCDGLIPPHPPQEAIDARRKQANAAARNDHYHTVANPANGEKPGERGSGPVKSTGYRPGRKSQTRRKKTLGMPHTGGHSNDVNRGNTTAGDP